jgi:uncharacterized membrane protein
MIGAAPRRAAPGRSPMKQLARWFVQGLIVLLPLATTVWVVTHVFNEIDALFTLSHRALPGGGSTGQGEPVPGLGFAFAIVTITIVGWLASLFVGRWLVRLTDWLIGRVPLVSSLYLTLRDILRAVAGDRKTFDRPVVVTLFPGGTAKVLGFVTRDDLHEIGLPGEVAVLLQQSLNFAGNLVIFPKGQVRALDVDAGRFFTFLMSGGLAGHLAKDAAPDSMPRLDDPEK